MSDTLSSLFEQLDALKDSIVTMECRIVPTSFDPNDAELRALPRPYAWHWRSLKEALLTWKPRVVMSRIPLFWQVESALHRACLYSESALFINDQANMPVAEAAIRSADVDTIVTTASDAFALSYYLAQKNTVARSWFIIHTPYNEWNIPATLTGCAIAHEVHLFPGVPLLEQCPALVESGDLIFHATPEFTLEISDRDTRISAHLNQKVSINDFRIPVRMIETGSCQCGRACLKRVPNV